MPTFQPRRYQATNGDLERLTRLIQAAWRTPSTPPVFHIGDLYWRLRDPAYEDCLWLWETDTGQLAGMASWQPSSRTLEIQPHPACNVRELYTEILTWAESQTLRTPESTTPLFTATPTEGDATIATLLRTRGYQQQDFFTNVHRRVLLEDLETPQLSSGYTVRSLRGPEELAARVQGHRAGWQSTLMTETYYERLMQMPGYRFDLDLVVVGPDQTFVATCNCWLDSENQAGLFEPVSTHPEHRRKGLARAMTLYGMNQLRTLGATEAWVCSVSQNPGATLLYESCGIPIARRHIYYSR